MYKAKWNKPDYQSFDNGKTWRIVGNFDFRRQDIFGVASVAFAGMYNGKRNYWIVAKIVDGEIVYINPRNVKIPQYAQQIVAEMLAQ